MGSPKNFRVYGMSETMFSGLKKAASARGLSLSEFAKQAISQAMSSQDIGPSPPDRGAESPAGWEQLLEEIRRTVSKTVWESLENARNLADMGVLENAGPPPSSHAGGGVVLPMDILRYFLWLTHVTHRILVKKPPYGIPDGAWKEEMDVEAAKAQATVDNILGKSPRGHISDLAKEGAGGPTSGLPEPKPSKGGGG